MHIILKAFSIILNIISDNILLRLRLNLLTSIDSKKESNPSVDSKSFGFQTPSPLFSPIMTANYSIAFSGVVFLTRN